MSCLLVLLHSSLFRRNINGDVSFIALGYGDFELFSDMSSFSVLVSPLVGYFSWLEDVL